MPILEWIRSQFAHILQYRSRNTAAGNKEFKSLPDWFFCHNPQTKIWHLEPLKENIKGSERCWKQLQKFALNPLPYYNVCTSVLAPADVGKFDFYFFFNRKRDNQASNRPSLISPGRKVLIWPWESPQFRLKRQKRGECEKNRKQHIK